MATLKSTPPAADLGIVYIERSRIKFWANNPRRNDKAAVEVATLLEANGMRSPINLWDRNMVVYKGNTTLKGLDLIHGSNKKIPGIKYEGGKIFIPVILHAFPNEEKAIAYGLSDNKAGEYSEWDDDILGTMLASKSMAPHLAATGFKEKEIANLTWAPDQTRLKNIQETSEGMLQVVKVFVKPEDKEEVIALLQNWAEGSGFEGVVVK